MRKGFLYFSNELPSNLLLVVYEYSLLMLQAMQHTSKPLNFIVAYLTETFEDLLNQLLIRSRNGKKSVLLHLQLCV